jgi:hypothetical protein
MKQNFKQSGTEPKRLLGYLAAERKKAVAALCLIAVMVLMWGRVLLRKTPESAQGAMTGQGAKLKDEGDSTLKVSFIELPKLEGRNDVLTRDFFASNGWQEFFRDRGAGGEEVSVVSKNSSEEVIRRVAGKLKLEAIGLGGEPRAFINDKVVSIRDKLTVGEGGSVYECEVVGIEEDRVFIRCKESEITLKLTQGAGAVD